eukprot:1150492-Pelagomonas_calceolata.AAC.1
MKCSNRICAAGMGACRSGIIQLQGDAGVSDAATRCVLQEKGFVGAGQYRYRVMQAFQMQQRGVCAEVGQCRNRGMQKRWNAKLVAGNSSVQASCASRPDAPASGMLCPVLSSSSKQLATAEVVVRHLAPPEVIRYLASNGLMTKEA